MREHRCVFDSDHGIFVSSHRTVYLMCECGRWGVARAGEWRYIGIKRAPEPCRTLTFFARLFRFFTQEKVA